jgi:hypothetical protein
MSRRRARASMSLCLWPRYAATLHSIRTLLFSPRFFCLFVYAHVFYLNYLQVKSVKGGIKDTLSGRQQRKKKKKIVLHFFYFSDRRMRRCRRLTLPRRTRWRGSTLWRVAVSNAPRQHWRSRARGTESPQSSLTWPSTRRNHGFVSNTCFESLIIGFFIFMHTVGVSAHTLSPPCARYLI